MRTPTFYVYMTASLSRTLYVGVTKDLQRRMYQHRHKLLGGFTAKYQCDRLVWFESTGNVSAAIAREKQLKGWKREKKIELVETETPGWHDLAVSLGLLPPEEDETPG